MAKLLDQRQPLSEQAVRTLLGADTPLAEAARVVVAAVDLRQYDDLLEGLDETGGDTGVFRAESSDNGMSL